MARDVRADRFLVPKDPTETEAYRIMEHPVGSLLGEQEVEAVRRVIESKDWLTRGKEVYAFEDEFARYCNVKHALAMSSCTGALHIAAQVLGLGKGDEVICQDQTFWVTAAALVGRGVTIRCADIDPETLHATAQSIERLITSKTKAIYVMHHGGNPVDMDPIVDLAHRRGIVVVEDAAHAPGAEYKGRKVGGIGDITCFSFSTLKNMITLGEGGMLTTNNDEYATMADGLRTVVAFGKKTKRKSTSLGKYPKPEPPLFDHSGDAWDYDWTQVDEVGTAYRLSTPQAAVGRVQLARLDSELNARRTEIAERYNKAIENIPGLRPVTVRPSNKSVWHLYTCFLDPRTGIERNKFIYRIEQTYGIQIILRFWPVHLQGPLRMAGHRPGECPVCERVWFEEQLNLPICPSMEDWEVDAVINGLQKTMADLKR